MEIHLDGAIIKNITVEGEINGDDSAGGISANGAGVTFINCINKVNVKSGRFIGGIAGSAYEGGKFINCINYGKIEGGQFNAGILGWDWSKNSTICNCMNANNAIVAITRNIYTNDTIKLFNTINIGNCTNMVVGSINKVKNCFNLQGSTSSSGNTAIIEYSEEKMKSEEFVNELNTFIETGGNDSNIDTTGWAKWIYNENDFPTLDVKTTWNGTEWETNE